MPKKSNDKPTSRSKRVLYKNVVEVQKELSKAAEALIDSFAPADRQKVEYVLADGIEAAERGYFGLFVAALIESIEDEKEGKLQDINETLDRISFMMQHYFSQESTKTKDDQMPAEFGLGYLAGLASSALTNPPVWGKMGDVYHDTQAQIRRSVSRERGKQRHKWVPEMKDWLKQKLHEEYMNDDGTLKASFRQVALSVREEAMACRTRIGGGKWATEQAAFEWLQKAVSEAARE